jgi:hypothetical protein
MNRILINDDLKQLDLIKRASGSQRETIVREAFKDLLKAWGRQHELIFLAEYPLCRPLGKSHSPAGPRHDRERGDRAHRGGDEGGGALTCGGAGRECLAGDFGHFSSKIGQYPA